MDAIIGVPLCVTSGPRKFREKRHPKVVQGPGQDDVVVRADYSGQDDHTVSYPYGKQLKRYVTLRHVTLRYGTSNLNCRFT